MFLFGEVGALHLAVWLIEIADRVVGEEVLGLHESKVHWFSVVVVKHHDVSIGS